MPATLVRRNWGRERGGGVRELLSKLSNTDGEGNIPQVKDHPATFWADSEPLEEC